MLVIKRNAGGLLTYTHVGKRCEMDAEEPLDGRSPLIFGYCAERNTGEASILSLNYLVRRVGSCASTVPTW